MKPFLSVLLNCARHYGLHFDNPSSFYRSLSLVVESHFVGSTMYKQGIILAINHKTKNRKRSNHAGTHFCSTECSTRCAVRTIAN